MSSHKPTKSQSKQWEGSKADNKMDAKAGYKEGSKRDNAVDRKMASKLTNKK